VKALTVRQPYATEIIRGRKTLEVRSKPTHFRGELVIHAAQAAAEGWEWSDDPEERAQYPTGVILGTVEVVDCRPFTRADIEASFIPAEWFEEEFPEDQWAWVLANPRQVRQVAAKGKLSLWPVDDEVIVYL
jgi:hypothetical protein